MKDVYFYGDINVRWSNILSDINIILTSSGSLDIDAMIDDYLSRHQNNN